MLLQFSEAAQVTEIASTGKASGSNVHRLKMTVSCPLNLGNFSFYSFKLRVSLHVVITLGRGKLIVSTSLLRSRVFFLEVTQCSPQSFFGEGYVTSQKTAANETMLPLLAI